MFNSILCPIDFSEPSIRALDYALSLAARERGHVALVSWTHTASCTHREPTTGV